MSEGSVEAISAVGGLRVFTEIRVKKRWVNDGNDRDCLLGSSQSARGFCV